MSQKNTSGPFSQQAQDVFQMMRVPHYLKNGFIFLPLFFSLNLENIYLLREALTAFVGFSLCASGIYVFNDIWDIREDREHPVKKSRPLPSGRVSVPVAYGLMAVFLAAGLLTVFCLNNIASVSVLVAYVLMNIAYSLGLKHVAILDITIIAIGFVLRVIVGSTAIEVEPSVWIILMTFLLALFLGSAKRREDILLVAKGHKTRKNIDGYNLEFVNAIMLTMAAVTIVAYIMYTLSPEVMRHYHSSHVYATTFFVILGILRYMQGTFVEDKSGCPTKFLQQDWFIKFTILGWILAFAVLLYF